MLKSLYRGCRAGYNDSCLEAGSSFKDSMNLDAVGGTWLLPILVLACALWFEFGWRQWQKCQRR